MASSYFFWQSGFLVWPVLMLGDARLIDHPIGVIAFESGFTSQPYFNRAFRARFGAAPSEVRAQLRREHDASARAR